MNYKELISYIAEAHNAVADIKVSGDDTIRMATTLKLLRNVVQELSEHGLDSMSKAEDPIEE